MGNLEKCWEILREIFVLYTLLHRVPICPIGKFTKEKNLERTQKPWSNFQTECQHLTSLIKADEGGGNDNDGDDDGNDDDDNDGDGGEIEHESGQETWEEEPPWDQLPRLGSDKIYANLAETDHSVFQDQFFITIWWVSS